MGLDVGDISTLASTLRSATLWTGSPQTWHKKKSFVQTKKNFVWQGKRCLNKLSTVFSCEGAAQHVHLSFRLSVHLSISKLNFSLFTHLYTPLHMFICIYTCLHAFTCV